MPSALGLTIPMAVLVGILIGLGRMSGDRESVALLSCGVSPYRLLRPIGVLAMLSALATAYVMIVAIPNANQSFREITFSVISQRVETTSGLGCSSRTSRGGCSTQGRTGSRPTGLEESDGREYRQGDETTIYFANNGRLVVDREKRAVDLVLTDGTFYRTGKGDTDHTRFTSELVLRLNPDAIFPDRNLQPESPRRPSRNSKPTPR